MGSDAGPLPCPALRRIRSSPPRQSVGPLRSGTVAVNCSAPLIGCSAALRIESLSALASQRGEEAEGERTVRVFSNQKPPCPSGRYRLVDQVLSSGLQGPTIRACQAQEGLEECGKAIRWPWPGCSTRPGKPGYSLSSSSNAFASFKSAVSKPSVNQP